MKKFLASLSVFCAISAHAQPAGFVLLSDIQGGQAYIGNVKPQFLISDTSAKLAEYTIFFSQNGSFLNFVADCAKPDVTFSVRLDANGNKYRSNPSITPQGTIGWSANVVACANAYTWPETQKERQEPRTERPFGTGIKPKTTI